MSYSDRHVLVNITAGRSAHNALNAAEIRGTVEVANIGEGTHSVVVTFALDGTIYKVEPAVTEIVMKSTGNNAGESGSESPESTENGSENAGGTENSTQTGANSSENASEVTTETNGSETVESETQKTSEETGE